MRKKYHTMNIDNETYQALLVIQRRIPGKPTLVSLVKELILTAKFRLTVDGGQK